MDLTTMYPEGINEIVNDTIIDQAKEFYDKDEISDMELDAYITAKKAHESLN